MGFTRSTTNTEVHQNMPDYPSGEGYTTSQLKTAFDAPATGLKTDLNGLMTELEATDSAASIGATALDAGDDSDGNVQAKLEYLLSELQGIALGNIPDGTITAAKMNATYDGTLAKKDGTLQSGLNAEQLGGSTLATITALITATGHTTGTFTVNYANNPDGNYTLALGFQPSVVIYIRQNTTGASVPGFPLIGVAIGSTCMYYDTGSDTWKTNSPTLSSTGITLKNFTTKSGDTTYTHNMSYVAFR